MLCAEFSIEIYVTRVRLLRQAQGYFVVSRSSRGNELGSVAIDEINNLMVVNSMHNPNVVRLFPRNEMTGDEQFGIGGTQLEPHMLRILFSFYLLSSLPVLGPLTESWQLLTWQIKKLFGGVVWEQPETKAL